MSAPGTKREFGPGHFQVGKPTYCRLPSPSVGFNPEAAANTDDVADAYWWAHQQPRSAWSNEIELRPYTELWTC